MSYSAGELARSQRELDQTLETRRGALETLLTHVNARREDFESVMESFGALVDESFKQAETRARDIGSFLTEATQATAGLIEQQFGEIRSNTGKERERTASALRGAYDQANTELNTIMRQATDRFETAAAEMRGMARAIQEELEATRAEVHRSVTDLPQETAEQAAAMRRIVFDQVRALNELTEIVTKSGRTFDVAEQPTAAPAAPDRPSAPFRKVEASACTRAFAGRRAAGAASRSPPQRVVPVPPAAVVRPQAPTDRGGGWLSDLLARASRDEQPAAPVRPPLEDNNRAAIPRGPARHTPSSSIELETISLDISRMIDADAAADAWDRYRRGEADTFTTHLYTARGQQTFDEIRRRYRTDPEFHKTVDRYVKEFERLLSDVNRDDRDDTVTRSYLASETGKVYTMLAHAAGRLS